MTFEIKPDPLPLTRLPDGTIRVTGTRVGFDLVIYAFQQGRTPKEIIESWETLDLADVYTLIGFYLKHKEAVDEYVRWYDAEGEKIRQKIEALQSPPPWTRADLEARLRERGQLGPDDTIDDISLLALALDQSEIANRVVFLPL